MESKDKGRLRARSFHQRRGRRGRGTPLERFVEPCVLLLLCNGPAHGYDLRQGLLEHGLVEDALDMGNLYRTLRRMEEDGWLHSAWVTDSPGPHKRVYEINNTGRQSLQSWAIGLQTLQGVLERFFELFQIQFPEEDS